MIGLSAGHQGSGNWETLKMFSEDDEWMIKQQCEEYFRKTQTSLYQDHWVIQCLQTMLTALGIQREVHVVFD